MAGGAFAALFVLACWGGARAADSSSIAQLAQRSQPLLRGTAASQDPPSVPAWLPLGDRQVADEEGEGLLAVSGALEVCERICSHYKGCNSFAYCGSQCYLKDGKVNSSSASHFNAACTTYYRGHQLAIMGNWFVPGPGPAASQQSPGGSATTTPAASATGPDECHSFRSPLAMNQLQQYSGNPEPTIHGTVDLTLCTNGTMVGTLMLEGGHSEIIATHIHRCKGGQSPQTRTAALCSGPAVVNFCGSGAAGLIADGSKYGGPCSTYGSGGESITAEMQGVQVLSAEENTMSSAELVRDIAMRPDMYYFNVHTLASYNHWYPHHNGVCRGPLQEKAAAVPATTAAPPRQAENRCYSFYSQLTLNELQIYTGNPDSMASGYASLTLCTNGTFSGTALVFGGVSEIIAMHIHKCEGGDTPQTRSADLCEGPPVANFCGSSAAGLVADGTAYPEACAPYAGMGASRTEGMRGQLVFGKEEESTTAAEEIVRDMMEKPEKYYFNVHTLASYNHWYPKHKGMVRGPMQVWTQS